MCVFWKPYIHTLYVYQPYFKSNFFLWADPVQIRVENAHTHSSLVHQTNRRPFKDNWPISLQPLIADQGSFVTLSIRIFACSDTPLSGPKRRCLLTLHTAPWNTRNMQNVYYMYLCYKNSKLCMYTGKIFSY